MKMLPMMHHFASGSKRPVRSGWMGPHRTFALTVYGFGDQKRIDEIREALWKPRSDQPKDQPKGEKRHRQEGRKSAGSAQEKSSSSQSSDSSDSTSSSESCSGDKDDDADEDEEPKKKKNQDV